MKFTFSINTFNINVRIKLFNILTLVEQASPLITERPSAWANNANLAFRSFCIKQKFHSGRIPSTLLLHLAIKSSICGREQEVNTGCKKIQNFPPLFAKWSSHDPLCTLRQHRRSFLALIGMQADSLPIEMSDEVVNPPAPSPLPWPQLPRGRFWGQRQWPMTCVLLLLITPRRRASRQQWWESKQHFPQSELWISRIKKRSDAEMREG